MRGLTGTRRRSCCNRRLAVKIKGRRVESAGRPQLKDGPINSGKWLLWALARASAVAYSSMDLLSWDVSAAPSLSLSVSSDVHESQPLSRLCRLPLPKRQATVSAWRQRLLIDPGSPALGSWLVRVKGGGLGCVACETGWAAGSDRMRYSNLLRHSRTRAHQRKVGQILGRKIGPEPDAAPPPELFAAALQDRLRGMSLRASGKGPLAGWHVKEEKIVRLTWCLGEALLDEDREFFRRPGVVVAMHQDVRADILCTRFAACSAHDLERRKGVLGLLQDGGSTASDLAAATTALTEQMCTPRLAPPRRSKLIEPASLDRVLLKKVLASVELFAADAASDEQKAARILAGRSSSPSSLPNLRAIIKDKTHAMVRHGAQRQLVSRQILVSSINLSL